MNWPHIRAEVVNLFILVVVLVISSVAYYRSTAKINAVASETHTALCAFKNDLERRLEASQEFLKRHPNGIPGIPAEDIQRSIENRQATLDSLVSLDCS